MQTTASSTTTPPARCCSTRTEQAGWPRFGSPTWAPAWRSPTSTSWWCEHRKIGEPPHCEMTCRGGALRGSKDPDARPQRRALLRRDDRQQQIVLAPVAEVERGLAAVDRDRPVARIVVQERPTAG